MQWKIITTDKINLLRELMFFRVKTLLGRCAVRRCRSNQQRLTVLDAMENYHTR